MPRRGQKKGMKKFFDALKDLEGDIGEVQNLTGKKRNQFLALIGDPARKRSPRQQRQLTSEQREYLACYVLPFGVQLAATEPTGAALDAVYYKTSVRRISKAIADNTLASGWMGMANVAPETPTLKTNSVKDENFYPALVKLTVCQVDSEGKIEMVTVTNRVQQKQEQRQNSRTASLPIGQDRSLAWAIDAPQEKEIVEGFIEWAKENPADGFRVTTCTDIAEEIQYVNIKGEKGATSSKESAPTF
ncbi:hypothetical protein BI308_23195 [Roseofilum reptotaenium AO1-A]|uniref:Uncharacterized protein n=1 Tax=Roseofilum reptotaenium AO1-A TaxID=1925591 RepID=A0A1L9QKK6_9CYAN|nr:hypothetical protein BI308_23195 [Roseofilum reptotaenium AO1-A]